MYKYTYICANAVYTHVHKHPHAHTYTFVIIVYMHPLSVLRTNMCNTSRTSCSIWRDNAAHLSCCSAHRRLSADVYNTYLHTHANAHADAHTCAYVSYI